MSGKLSDLGTSIDTDPQREGYCQALGSRSEPERTRAGGVWLASHLQRVTPSLKFLNISTLYPRLYPHAIL